MDRKRVFLRKLILTLLIVLCLGWYLILPAKGENLGQMVESFGDSIGQGLDNLGQQLNRANDSFLNNFDGQKGQSYEAQMRQYRRLEEARVSELADVTGVSSDTIRQMRSEGMTWEQIADKYGINLDTLPPPRINSGPSQLP